MNSKMKFFMKCWYFDDHQTCWLLENECFWFCCLQICLQCRRRGHSLKNCPEKNNESSEKKLCYNCGDTGHSLSHCPYPMEDGNFSLLWIRNIYLFSYYKISGNLASKFVFFFTSVHRYLTYDLKCSSCYLESLTLYSLKTYLRLYCHLFVCLLRVVTKIRFGCCIDSFVGGTKFASCFICKGQGHISKNCPENKHVVSRVIAHFR